ncbi:hypothetical protein GOB07_31695 [Sinorhizobium meliloti]|nr:hypothetical protein [Sinorhizobium meliloti]MDW9401135.1 hypothetical protein [Sinorhizobium meliloti]MDW9540497.1 hypothetical protein [Sinorhizobium meliloti]MDW9615502.1 hypothetical protein [Sinorhizobium meliloti]MDW9621906.1 hypothetical protein [Sinorhizobium meliloti]
MARYPQARSRSWSPVAYSGPSERSHEAIDDDSGNRRGHLSNVARAKRHHQPDHDPPDFSIDPVNPSEALLRTRILKH